MSQKVTTKKKLMYSRCITHFFAVECNHRHFKNRTYRNDFVFRSPSSTLQAEPKETR